MSYQRIPLRLVIAQLDPAVVISADLPPVLSVLAIESTIAEASKSELSHLCSRTLNLLRSNDNRLRWVGTKLAVVLSLYPSLLSEHGSNILNALVKILETQCFIDNDKVQHALPLQQLTTLGATVECMDFIVDNIRGKPTLTREVLTPRMPACISALIQCLHISPALIIPVLYKFLAHNSTTFRPFGAKYEKKLLNLLGDEQNFDRMPQSMQSDIAKSLVLLSYVLTRNQPEETWNYKLLDLVAEIGSTLSVYGEFMDLADEASISRTLASLPTLGETEPIFPGLAIDGNEPLDLLKVQIRLRILCEILVQYITTATQTIVKVPIAQLVAVSDLLLSINLKFVSMKREIRSTEIKDVLNFSFERNILLGVKILRALASAFKPGMVLHAMEVLSTLDSVVPMAKSRGSKAKVDDSKIHELSEVMLQVVECAAVYLKIVNWSNDLNSINNVVDVALVLARPQPQMQSATVSTKNGSKKSKKGTGFSASLSDSIGSSFSGAVSSEIRRSLRNFFTVALSTNSLTASKQTQVLQYAIVDAVTNVESLKNGNEPELAALLRAAVVYPEGQDTVSVLPIVTSLMGRDTLLSVLESPRFPLLPQRPTVVETQVDAIESHDEEDEDDDDAPMEEPEAKRQKMSPTFETEQAPELRPVAQTNILVKPIPKVEEPAVEPQVEGGKIEDIKVEDVKVEKASVEEVRVAELTVESDVGSDIEIPEIVMDSDDE